jgi:hypothetical protein
MAAHDMISQMRALHQRSLLHSWWHNSHCMCRIISALSLHNTNIIADVFAALGVMLAFNSLDEPSKQQVRLPKNLDVNEIIAYGHQLLEEVGGHLHPIAARYVKSLQRMEVKLKTVAASRTKVLEALPPPPVALHTEEMQPKPEYNAHNLFAGNMNDDFGQFQQMGGDASMMFVEDFSEIESMFYNTGWFGQVEWSDAPQS